jgi:hypothetical protein
VHVGSLIELGQRLWLGHEAVIPRTTPAMPDSRCQPPTRRNFSFMRRRGPGHACR